MKAAKMAKLYFNCFLMSFLPLCGGYESHGGGSGSGQSQHSPCYQCHFHGTCGNKRDGVTCHCYSGYTGDHCEHGEAMQTDNECKDNIHCLNGGTCYFDQNQAARCHCATGYSGVFCAYLAAAPLTASLPTTNPPGISSDMSTTTTAATVTTFPPTTTTTAPTTPSSTQSSTITTTLNPACDYFDRSLHPCKDNSACSLPHVQGVICPDPNEAHYCPITCGCCNNATARP